MNGYGIVGESLRLPKGRTTEKGTLRPLGHTGANYSTPRYLKSYSERFQGNMLNFLAVLEFSVLTHSDTPADEVM